MLFAGLGVGAMVLTGHSLLGGESASVAPPSVCRDYEPPNVSNNGFLRFPTPDAAMEHLISTNPSLSSPQKQLSRYKVTAGRYGGLDYTVETRPSELTIHVDSGDKGWGLGGVVWRCGPGIG